MISSSDSPPSASRNSTSRSGESWPRVFGGGYVAWPAASTSGLHAWACAVRPSRTGPLNAGASLGRRSRPLLARPLHRGLLRPLRPTCGCSLASAAGGRGSRSRMRAGADGEHRLGHRRRRFHAVALRADADRRPLARTIRPRARPIGGESWQGTTGRRLRGGGTRGRGSRGRIGRQGRRGPALSGWLLIKQFMLLGYKREENRSRKTRGQQRGLF